MCKAEYLNISSNFYLNLGRITARSGNEIRSNYYVLEDPIRARHSVAVRSTVSTATDLGLRVLTTRLSLRLT